ncbi:alkaline phosphatase family protein [Actinoplanes sp. TRM 88003]|uniref:Alkaline phosphatase family protein n=1 Tax=Paractinoplanes aksuensis TaxID=2939490 RepID=A0ABT1E1W1_9ACTN|nr:nucleotide pyrophosphatase/phosphodiesterase family protein [Actinoplanes aksuensis]MCO8276130.1 alkaline phosphatase family protein [Actinoplanes aksuensis]
MPLVVPDDRLLATAFEPVRPAYGSGSLADVLPSVSAVLGVPGAHDALGLGAELDGIERVAVLLVDGLGAHQIPIITPYAPVLADLAGRGRTLTAGFPSTTPVSLVTLGTGVPPGAHGVLGFTVRRPDGRVLNHIQWKHDPDPAQWQPVPTRFQLAAAAGVEVTVVNKPEFEGSGLTVSAYRGATYAPAAGALADHMLAALSAATGPALVYGYHADLDHVGHGDGVDSPRWRAAARDVEALLDHLVHGLPPRSALLVVADHGQLNVPNDARYDMADIPELRDGVVGVAGEPRVRYLYAAPGGLDDVRAAWQGVLGDAAWVLTRDEAIDAGWFGPVPADHRDRIGDLAVIAQGRAITLAGGWEPPSIGRLIAYHASVTAAEMEIPLLIAR